MRSMQPTFVPDDPCTVSGNSRLRKTGIAPPLPCRQSHRRHDARLDATYGQGYKRSLHAHKSTGHKQPRAIDHNTILHKDRKRLPSGVASFVMRFQHEHRPGPAFAPLRTSQNMSYQLHPVHSRPPMSDSKPFPSASSRAHAQWLPCDTAPDQKPRTASGIR